MELDELKKDHRFVEMPIEDDYIIKINNLSTPWITVYLNLQLK